MAKIVFGVDVAKGWIDSFGRYGHDQVATADILFYSAKVAAQGGCVVFRGDRGARGPASPLAVTRGGGDGLSG
ncbi:MAG: hypothetical protein U5N55_00325 [Cypionkella sp.]|nr:hypothetical protein [Cypionkella sp.]